MVCKCFIFVATDQYCDVMYSSKYFKWFYPSNIQYWLILSIAISIIPYYRMIQGIIVCDNTRVSIYSHLNTKFQQWLDGRGPRNQNMFKWFGDLTTVLEGLYFRARVECFALFFELTILVLVDKSIVENNSLVLISLMIKVVLISIATAATAIIHSYGFDIYTHITNMLNWTFPLVLTIVTFFILINGVLYVILNYDANTQMSSYDYNWFILQIYFYPTCFVSIIFSIRFTREITIKNINQGCVCLNRLPCINVNVESKFFAVVWWCLVAPLIFVGCFLLWLVAIALMGDSQTLDALLQDVCERQYWNRLPRIDSTKPHVKICKDKDFQGFYVLMNKICYFLLITSVSGKKKQSAEYNHDHDHGNYSISMFYQQMAIINTKIIEYSMQHNANGAQFTLSDSFKQELGKIRDNPKMAVQKQRRIFFDDASKDGLANAHPFTFKRWIRSVFYDFIKNQGLIDDYDVNGGMPLWNQIRGMIVLFYALHRLLFPFYCVFGFVYYNLPWNIYNLETIGITFVLFIILIYFTFGYFMVRYVIPLYYKLCFILPIGRLSEADHDSFGLINTKHEYPDIVETFRNESMQNINEIFKDILLGCKSLEMVRIKRQIVVAIIGHDIGQIIMDYVPLYDHLPCEYDSRVCVRAENLKFRSVSRADVV